MAQPGEIEPMVARVRHEEPTAAAPVKTHFLHEEVSTRFKVWQGDDKTRFVYVEYDGDFQGIAIQKFLDKLSNAMPFAFAVKIRKIEETTE